MSEKILEKRCFAMESMKLVDQNESDVFALVKIGVMHSGLNKNQTRHSLASIEDALPSLHNVPIGIKYNEDETDATSHLAIGESETLQHNIGTIPETNEIIIEKDMYGVSHVYVYGVIWKADCSKAYEILQNRELNQSMEEFVYNGEYLDDGTYDIKKFKFARIQLLSQGTEPAMEGANATLVTYSDEENIKVKQSNEFVKKLLKKNNEEVSMENDVKLEKLKVDYAKEVASKEKLQTSLDAITAKYAAVEKEAVELREYKAEIDKEKAHTAFAEKVHSKVSARKEYLSEDEIKIINEMVTAEKEMSEIDSYIQDTSFTNAITKINAEAEDKKEEKEKDMKEKEEEEKNAKEAKEKEELAEKEKMAKEEEDKQKFNSYAILSGMSKDEDKNETPINVIKNMIKG